MAYSDRQIRRMTEERTVIIDNVDTTNGQITMHDQYGTTLSASLDFSDPIIVVPNTGESWIAQRRNTNWYLSKRQSGASNIKNLVPGDVQITGTNIRINGNVVFTPAPSSSSSSAIVYAIVFGA